jgi:hypothetical protein
LLAGLFDLELKETCIWYDNQSCVNLTDNPMFHDKSKHVEIKYHYIRDLVQKGVVKLQYIGTDEHSRCVDQASIKGEVCVLRGEALCGPEGLP